MASWQLQVTHLMQVDGNCQLLLVQQQLAAATSSWGSMFNLAVELLSSVSRKLAVQRLPHTLSPSSSSSSSGLSEPLSSEGRRGWC